MLTTFGGNAEVAYRVARGFQRAYAQGEFMIMISGYCKSAGTLLAIGASRLIMSDDAQLGPLDVQLGKPDAIGEMMSGLTPCQSLAFLQEHAFKLFETCFLQLLAKSNRQIALRTATQIATELTTGLMGSLYGHRDPMRLGEYHRDMMVAFEYGKRLGERNLISEDALKKLTHGYPSHDFIIDREEARELFKNVDSPQNGLLEMLEILMPQIQKDLYHQDAAKNYIGVVGFLNVDIDLTPKNTQEKEVSTHGKQSVAQPESAGTKQPEPQPTGGGDTAKDDGKTPTPNTDTGGATSDQSDTEVVGDVKKPETDMESP